MRIVLQVLPGVAPALRAELSSIGWEPIDDLGGSQAEELLIEVPDGVASLDSLARLRTAVAAYVSIDSGASRPTGLTATEVQRAFRAVLDLVAQQRPRVRFKGLRLEAAGSDTPQMVRIATELAQLGGIPVDPDDGDLLVRARRLADGGPGWELLVRTTPRPLATRAWRTESYPGALNATIAAAVVDVFDPQPTDRFADLMCGSGTLTIERLARGAAEQLLAIDVDPHAIEVLTLHQRAARLRGRIEAVVGDVAQLRQDAMRAGQFTTIVSNPPWGELHGDHATNADLYVMLLDAIDHLGAEEVRAGILTHDIRRFEAVLAADDRWSLIESPQFFAKGHRPRLFVIERAV